MSGVAQKSAGDKIRIPCCFGNEPLLVDNAQIVNGVLVLPYSIVSFSITATPADLTVQGVQQDNQYQISALISGGTSGNFYYIQYSITLSDPDGTTISRTGALQVL